MPNRAIFWFRRDLRIKDNIGLYHAVKESDEVIPVFVFEDKILKTIKQDNQRFGFLVDALENLNKQLKKIGSYLHIARGDTRKELVKIIKKHSVSALYFNKAHSLGSIEQEKEVEKKCEQLNVEVRKYSDSLIVPIEKVPVRKVFTPFYRLWQKEVEMCKPLNIKKINSPKIKPKIISETIKDLKYCSNKNWPISFISQRAKEFDFCDYVNRRNFPYIDGSSKLSPYIRFGIISIRQLYNYVSSLGCPNDTYISELGWREFWYHIIHHFPECRDIEFQQKRRGLSWDNNQKHLEAWKEGRTGYPIVDAGMRQLKEEGWMHGRVRMIVASFLTKDLLIDWRYGDKHFYDYLVDYDENVDIGNWQWSASVGADPKPLRIFNPILQSQRFDPECIYIKKYIPELKDEEVIKIHDPVKYKLNYYEPIVDHYEATHNTKDVYNKSI